ncbi:MAG TPA: 16S rRNA (adenine(1518)-N(6)/adenine(1519)-N(6))-dimethyltransferase RsmA, partial [Terriglobia bacterium]|nr:16S rRNA (adenine(1518)-N(6)/adenine(1519)-N(6))-dimethyltransferase RsmA [Terriglobia bacterium]
IGCCACIRQFRRENSGTAGEQSELGSLIFLHCFRILRIDSPMLSPKKSLGQNFLRDENIARKIVQSLGVTQADVLLEIGPGQGDLTKLLLGTAPVVIGVEVDPRAAQILRERFGDRLLVREQDVLSLNLEETQKDYGRRLTLVGNIPYYITSDILFWMFDQRSSIDRAVFMMQWEVATRLVASAGSKTYGILSVFAQLFSNTTLLFKVSRNSFYPRPQVDSAVVRFGFGKSLPVGDERLLRNIVRTTFGTRRKTLRNGLRTMGYHEAILERLPVDVTRRPEELSPVEFAELSNALQQYSDKISLKF